MKALAYRNYGPPEALELMELPVPSPEAHEVLIGISYAGINPIDWKIGEGRLKGRVDFDFPLIVGRDLAGVVEAVGSEVTQFSPGDNVCAALPRPGGSFAEFAAVPERLVAKAPKGISLKDSASLPLVALTCWQALIDEARLEAGQTVFILSGAGGTGSLAVQIARNAGAVVLTTCGPANRAYVRELGAKQVYDYTSDDPIEEIRRLYPDGIDVVFSNSLGELHERSYGLLKSGGALVTIGEPPVPGSAEKLGVREVDLVFRPDGDQLAQIVQLIDSGKLRPPPVTEFPLEQCARALRLSMDGHVRGKIVLRVS